MAIPVAESTKTLQAAPLATLPPGINVGLFLDSANSIPHFPVCMTLATDANGYPTSVSYVAALPVVGTTNVVRATVTRPANTTAYSALQSVNTSTSSPTIITFTGAGRANGVSGYVTWLKLLTNQSGNTARFRLHLFSVNNPTLSNDGSSYTMMNADDANYQGSVDLPACQTEGSGSDSARAEVAGNLLAFKCANADSNLYGLLETLDAFTPTSQQTFRLVLGTESN